MKIKITVLLVKIYCVNLYKITHMLLFTLFWVTHVSPRYYSKMDSRNVKEQVFW